MKKEIVICDNCDKSLDGANITYHLQRNGFCSIVESYDFCKESCLFSYLGKNCGYGPPTIVHQSKSVKRPNYVVLVSVMDSDFVRIDERFYNIGDIKRVLDGVDNLV